MPIDLSYVVTVAHKAQQEVEDAVSSYRTAVQSHVDAQAHSRRYDSGNSMASYVASTNVQWAAEAQAFVAWRDAIWLYAYVELDKVLSGRRERPTIDALIAELPVIKWPERAS